MPYAASHIKGFYPRGRKALEIIGKESEDPGITSDDNEDLNQDIVPVTWSEVSNDSDN